MVNEKEKKKRKCNGTSIHQWQQQPPPRCSARVLPVVALNIKRAEEGGREKWQFTCLCLPVLRHVCVARATLKRHMQRVCERERDGTEICRRCWFYCFSYPSLNVATKIHDTPRNETQTATWRVACWHWHWAHEKYQRASNCFLLHATKLFMNDSAMHMAGANKNSLIFCSVRKSSRIISIKREERLTAAVDLTCRLTWLTHAVQTTTVSCYTTHVIAVSLH